VRRRSHLHLDQEPWSLVVSYYPMDIASGTPLEPWDGSEEIDRTSAGVTVMYPGTPSSGEAGFSTYLHAAP
jgi:hypothetical protein